MPADVRKWLYDALSAAQNITVFVNNKTFEEYSRDILLKSAVERQFEIAGEALKRIRETHESAIERIQGYRGAISFRNILAHGYDAIDDELVWDIIQKDLPDLTKSLTAELNK